MKLKDGCFCLVFEFGNPFKNKPLSAFKFNSRIMWRIGFAWCGLCLIKMSLSDYDKECQSSNTEWIK